MSSASNTTAPVCQFTDITSHEVCNCCQSASVDGLLSFSFTNVFEMSVLIHKSPVCAVNASMFASLSTTNVSPIASGGRTDSDIFQLAFNAATPFGWFFSSCSMNCGADAFGHNTNWLFTVRSSPTVALHPIFCEPSTFKSISISTDFLKFEASSTVRVHESLVFHVAVRVQSNIALFQLISAPLMFPVAVTVQFTVVLPAVSVH